MKILKFNRIFNLVIFSLSVFAINHASQSPFAWETKAKILKNYNPGIGPLNGVVRTNNFLYKRNFESHALTFGNSQVGSVFAGNQQGAENIYWTFIPSLPIPCYKYFEDAIIKSNPQYLILYLSDIDMTLNPFYIPLKYHNFSLLRYLNDQNEIISKELVFSKSEFVTIFFSELIKPLKESVFLKTMIEKAFFYGDNDSKRPTKIQKPEASTKKESEALKPVSRKQKPKTQKTEESVVGFDIQLASYSKEIQKLIYNRNQVKYGGQIEFNRNHLLAFCSKLNDNGIQTIIVDGQYHPDAYNYIGQEVGRPNEIISAICARYQYLHHLPLEAMTRLDSSHYIDHIHFTKAGGKTVRDEIAEFVEKLKLQDEQN